MRYWDSSAVIALLVAENVSLHARTLFQSDALIATAWITSLECLSALARRRADGSLTAKEFEAARAALAQMAKAWQRIVPSEIVLAAAESVILSQGLRTGDALQLGSALVAGRAVQAKLEFVMYDVRLRVAAEAEGLVALSA